MPLLSLSWRSPARRPAVLVRLLLPVTFLIAGLTPAVSAEEETLADILRLWEERRAKIESLHCEWRVERYQTPRKGEFAVSGEGTNDSDNQQPALRRKGQASFSFEGERMAFVMDLEHDDPVEPDVLPTLLQHMVFDGSNRKETYVTVTELRPGAGIASTDSPADTLVNSVHLMGLWLSFDPFAQLQRMGRDPLQVTLGRRWTDGQGNRCVELITVPPIPSVYEVLHVDLTRGGLPIRLEREVDGQRTRLLTVEYVPDSQVDWRVARWTDHRFWPGGAPRRALYCEVEDFQINMPPPGHVWDVHFPEDTHVWVRDEAGNMEFFAVGASGAMVPISSSEFGRIEPKVQRSFSPFGALAVATGVVVVLLLSWRGIALSNRARRSTAAH